MESEPAEYAASVSSRGKFKVADEGIVLNRVGTAWAPKTCTSRQPPNSFSDEARVGGPILRGIKVRKVISQNLKGEGSFEDGGESFWTIAELAQVGDYRRKREV